jgi:hypothetical protein
VVAKGLCARLAPSEACLLTGLGAALGLAGAIAVARGVGLLSRREGKYSRFCHLVGRASWVLLALKAPFGRSRD